jgi:DNA-binding phage protein
MEVRTILKLDDIRAKLQDRNLTAVAKSANVSRPVLYQIMRGSTDPKFSTIEKLSDYLQK